MDTSSPTTERDLAADLVFALGLADAVDALTLPRFEDADFTLGWKDDRTEVTEVDRTAERLLADLVNAGRPDDRFVGEEFGTSTSTESGWVWIVDPIDGTSGFVRGIPVWASLIALVHEPTAGRPTPVVGVVSAPALGRRWWASSGGGTFASNYRSGAVSRLQVSTVGSIPDAQVSVTLNDGWAELGCVDALSQLMIDARRARGVGDFWQHCLVAEGSMDVAIDAIGVAPYDIAAVRLIVSEAGGRFSDIDGIETHESGSAVSSNGLLHDQVLARFAARR